MWLRCRRVAACPAEGLLSRGCDAEVRCARSSGAERRRAWAQVLREAEGALELVNVSDSLPELRRVPGLHTWGVQAKEGFFTSWEAAQAVRCLLLLLATRCILCSAAVRGSREGSGRRRVQRDWRAACSRPHQRLRRLWSAACACCRTTVIPAASLWRFCRRRASSPSRPRPRAPAHCGCLVVLFTRHVCTNSRQRKAAGMSGRKRVENRHTLCQAVVLRAGGRHRLWIKAKSRPSVFRPPSRPLQMCWQPLRAWRLLLMPAWLGAGPARRALTWSLRPLTRLETETRQNVTGVTLWAMLLIRRWRNWLTRRQTQLTRLRRLSTKRRAPHVAACSLLA